MTTPNIPPMRLEVLATAACPASDCRWRHSEQGGPLTPSVKHIYEAHYREHHLPEQIDLKFVCAFFDQHGRWPTVADVT